MKKARLALVVDNAPVGARRPRKAAKPHVNQRPVTVQYPWGTQGHCVSVKNAIKCATRNMLDHEFKRVNIEVDIDGENYIVADLDMINNRIVTSWVRGWLNYEVER